MVSKERTRALGRWASALILVVAACGGNTEPPTTTPQASPSAVAGSLSPDVPSATASRVERRGETPVALGEPVGEELLTGRIVFDDFEDVYTMNADGSGLRRIAGRPGAEFDGAWSPDGRMVVYRDSRRGINEDDEIYVVAADGSGARNLSNDPANDWGPDWSADGEWIAFNSDRGGGALRGFLVRPDGTGLRRIDTDGWFEYPSFSPDGRRIAFEAPDSDYDVYVADLETGRSVRLTEDRKSVV